MSAAKHAAVDGTLHTINVKKENLCNEIRTVTVMCVTDTTWSKNQVSSRPKKKATSDTGTKAKAVKTFKFYQT